MRISDGPLATRSCFAVLFLGALLSAVVPTRVAGQLPSQPGRVAPNGRPLERATPLWPPVAGSEGSHAESLAADRVAVSTTPPSDSEKLTWQVLNNPEGWPTVILFDRSRQVLAVYQVSPESGLISLKSVRRVAWDLELDHFNTNKPTPEDVRGMRP